jgi:EAL domain-containing protein (putative c-di-GMP-specific phosphodiesterase class I)/GGDEF domain-containing protein
MEDGRLDNTKLLLESWLDLHKTIDANPEVRALLFDQVTGLPTTPLVFPRISALLEERGEVSLLCVNVARYSRIEEIFGWKAFDNVMCEVAVVLDEIAGEVLRDSDVIAELMISGNAFVIVLSPPRVMACMDPQSRIDLARRVEEVIGQKIQERMDPALYKKFGCYVGSATVCQDENVRVERLVYDGLERALGDSYAREAEDGTARVDRLRDIIDREDVSTLVHPVFDLESMDVIGYEALSRGPEGSEFERPDKLFAVAYDADLVLRLERLCRKRALQAAAGMKEDRLLFVNVEPEAIADPQLRDIVTSSLLEESALPSSRVVLEITERAAITDFGAFRATLEYVRALGFTVAVDDAGAGYGSLQCMAEVRPEWLKIDLSLVRGVDSDDIRATLVESLVTLAERVGARLIAEGIETAEELEALRRLGVKYGQGFLLALPSAPFPEDADLPARQFAR